MPWDEFHRDARAECPPTFFPVPLGQDLASGGLWIPRPTWLSLPGRYRGREVARSDRKCMRALVLCSHLRYRQMREYLARV